MPRIQSRRSGVVLLVVVSLLMLFAVVGLAFVIYAEAQASTARIWKESSSLRQPDMDTEELLAYFLSQLIYDTDRQGSALRGHSLACNLYGQPGGVVPFCGSGRRPGEYSRLNAAFGADPNQAGTPNPPYTYPDINHPFLAAVRARDGAVLIQSYQRHAQTGFDGNWSGSNQREAVLRPLPSDHASFPPPADAGGDVKNLADSPGYLIGNNQFASNDSFWIDLAHPTMTAADGRKFKPLFAPLIVDLDNRVNVNVHGHNMESSLDNIGAKQQGLYEFGRHMSTEGWGPWEVNLERVLRAADGDDLFEARRIFVGNEGVAGRYDRDFWSFDVAGPTPPYNTLIDSHRRKGQFYSRTDFEAEWVGKRPNEFGYPGQMYRMTKGNIFPTIPDWYANGGRASEGGFHAQLFNFFEPGRSTYAEVFAPRKDRIFPITDMEALLRYGDTGSPALTSDLFRVVPKCLSDANQGGKRRRLLTTHAFDVDYPGIMGGDPRFAPTIGRQPIDLNKPLPAYPGLNGQKRINNMQEFDRAQTARQELAQEIFDVLRQVAGGNLPPGPDELRRYAQLAVNIVDFRDEDDFLTPFRWQNQDYVFGNELPRLVVSEAYAEIANHADDENQPRATRPYQVRFWVELHNPLTAGLKVDGGLARLQRPDDNQSYCLVIAEKASENAAKLDEPGNTLGDVAAANIKIDIDDYSGAGMNPPPPPPEVNTSSYLLLGPDEDFPSDTQPDPLLRIKDDNDKNRMYYEVRNSTDPAEAAKTTHTILLRRLACPFLPEQGDPALPQYNPFVTVDTLDLNDPINDAVAVTNSGVRANAPDTVMDKSKRFSVGREQPYAAALVKDQKPNPALTDEPQHTLTKKNTPNPTNQRPYRWLTFMDRELISPVELLQVSAQPPHRLTRTFITQQQNQLTPFNHRAKWFDEDIPPDANGKKADTHGLYRLFAYLSAGPLMQGSCVGGRVIGRININNIWDVETFMALADPYLHNYYDEAAAEVAFRKLLQSRTPGGAPAAGDRPFMGPALPFSSGDPQFPAGIGLDDTFFRADPADPNRRLFEIDPMARFPNDQDQARRHPYLQYEMMKKMYNQVTNRSNVFAVWLTVGFFEVVDDSDPSRPRLGAEIGLEEGRNVRHRMFALIDRSSLTVGAGGPGAPGPRPFAMNTEAEVRTPGEATIKIPWVKGQYEDVAYEIRGGDQLVIDVGPNQELITVTRVDLAGNTLTAQFSKPHARGVPLTNVLNGLRDGGGQPVTRAGGIPVGDPKLTWLGNPGPQPRFDMRSPRYAGVVRYFSIIE